MFWGVWQVTTCGILVFIDPGVAQTLYGIVIAVFWVVLFAKLAPFPSLAENVAQTGLNFCVVIIMLGALALKLDLTGESDMSLNLVTGLLWVATVAPLVTVVGAFSVELLYGDAIGEERWATLLKSFSSRSSLAVAEHAADTDPQDDGGVGGDLLRGPHPSADIREAIELGMASEA